MSFLLHFCRDMPPPTHELHTSANSGAVSSAEDLGLSITMRRDRNKFHHLAVLAQQLTYYTALAQI